MRDRRPRDGTKHGGGRRATAGLLAVKVANAGIGLVTVVLLARWMGSTDYGLFVFAITLAQFAAVPLHFGLPTLLVRETAILVQVGKLGLLRGLIRWSYGLILAGTLIALGLGLLVVVLIWELEILADNLWLVGMAALAVPLLAVNKLTLGVLNGLRRTVASRVPDALVRPGLVLAFAVLAAWHGWLDATSMVGFYLLAAAVAFVVGILMMRTALPAGLQTMPAAYDGRIWIKSLLPLTAIAAVQMVNNQTDIVMLGVLSDKADVAYYKVAAQLATLPLIVQTAVNAVLSPRIAAGHANGDHARVQALILRATRWVLAGVLVFMVPLALGGSTLIPLVFGAEYAVAYMPFVFLGVGVSFAAGSGAVMTLLNMCGLETQVARLAFFSALANLGLNLVLIPSFGLVGAALATAVTTIGLQFFALRICRQRLGYAPHVFGGREPR